ncbi:MAG: hypothetical protein WD847_03905 [Pirellulales bacterium]
MNPPDDEHLDSLLTRAVEALEPCPPGLVGRIESRLRRRRARRAAAGAALAAALLLAAGSYVFWPDAQLADRQDEPKNDSTIADAAIGEPRIEPDSPSIENNGASPPHSRDTTGSEPKAKVRLAAGFIGEPLESSNPRITILWVYPASRTDDAQGFPESRSPSNPPAPEARVAKLASGRGSADSIVN